MNPINPNQGYNPLDGFLNWWRANGNQFTMAPVDAVTRYENITLLTLYRDEHFQVQLTICDPNSVIPEHGHPGVDLYEVYISGDLLLSIDGREIIKPEHIKDPVVQASLRGSMHYLPAGTKHSAVIGERGASFMTIQLHHAAMKCLSLCWNGQNLDEDHGKRLSDDSARRIESFLGAPKPALYGLGIR